MSKSKKKRTAQRIVQLLTGVHRIHHPRYAYGWRLPFIGVAFFPRWESGRDEHYRVFPAAWHRVARGSYHDCTASGVY